MLQKLYERYFTLDEAVRMLPFVKQTFSQALAELDELRDQVVLYKRMHQIQQSEGVLPRKSDMPMLVDVLHQKWYAYEECFYRWVNALADKGIQVRDFRRGLIDFPYKAKDGTEYCLCWQLGEEGIFYFHDVYEGFSGRRPISFLPE